MTEQNAGTETGGPGNNQSGPAQGFMTELQTMTGAHATETAPTGTPAQGGDQASATGQPGGGNSPASPPATSGEQNAVMAMLNKINQRMDAQGQFLTKLDSKVAQTRQEFENRYTQAPKPAGDGEVTDENPPQLDQSAIIRGITEAVVAQVRSDLKPYAQQTAANTVAQKVAQAQVLPQVQQMVQELPPDVKANLSAEVYKIAGDKVFAEPNPLFDTPDPVHEAIELLHYRTVVKTGRQPAQAPQAGQANEPNPQGFSPVPNTGTHSQVPVVNEQEEEAQTLFNIKLGPQRTRYPAAIEKELGMS